MVLNVDWLESQKTIRLIQLTGFVWESMERVN